MTTTEMVPIAPGEEKSLIDRVLHGETEAFEQLLAPCAAPMRRFALRVLRNVADAEEALQMAALRAYSRLSTFRCEARFATWFYQIARNEIYQVRRRNWQRNKHFGVIANDEDRDLSSQWRDSRPSQLEVLEMQQVAQGLDDRVSSRQAARAVSVELRGRPERSGNGWAYVAFRCCREEPVIPGAAVPQG